MSHLISERNREPIKTTAKRIGRSERAAIDLCKRGILAHQRDRCGRYWSSKPAAEDFMGPPVGGASSTVDWVAKAKEALGV